jgi:hypothetical protein
VVALSLAILTLMIATISGILILKWLERQYSFIQVSREIKDFFIFRKTSLFEQWWKIPKEDILLLTRKTTSFSFYRWPV